jgi:hypothetical protein
MRKLIYSNLIVLCLLAGAAWGAPPQSSRRTLDQSTVIQGYHCAKGYAWIYANGSLFRCTLGQDSVIGEATVPVGSIIALLPDGKPEYVQMSHDSSVQGYNCQGGGLLGPGEGPVVEFYPSGKLKLCFLANDQDIQGVPCSKGGIFASLNGPDPGVIFHESGKLRRCRLTRDFAALRKGNIFQQLE